MNHVPIDPFQRSPVGEASSAAQIAPAEEHDLTSNDNLLSKIRQPTKAARRIRGEIACAECRRLKIRCDKTVPCSTCVKRGCSALCPNGTIPPGEGSRFVLAATEHLQQKLTRLEVRMRSLEDSLAIIYAPFSDKPHPLLARTNEDLYGDDNETPQPHLEDHARSSPGVGDFLGTLCMDAQGASRFFGPSGGSESLLMKSQGMNFPSFPPLNGPPVRELDPSYLTPAINHCYQSFPFPPPNVVVTTVQASIESFLPSLERAIALCDTFTENLAYMFNIISRQTLVHELIPVIYKRIPGQYGPHELALLLIVLGIGCLVDLTLPPYGLEAQHYHRLARATLALQPVLGEQSVTTVKVLHLMSMYNGMSGQESNLEQSYALLDLSGQVAVKIGLHVDPSSWGFQGREAYERRVYFWNLMSAVLWQSLVTGRPPSLLTSYIDCRIPTLEEENEFQQGEFPTGFGIWGHRANSECLMPLARATLAARSPSYETILDLDRTIRGLLGPHADIIESDTHRTAISMRIFVRSHYQELMRMFLHRAYFAQAMSEYPDDPLNSPCGQSVSLAYTSACIILQDTRAHFLREPMLCSRVWRIWLFTFTAAIIVGTVAIRGVQLDLKPPPLEEFEAICEVFNSAAETNSRAARAVPILQVMLRKAYLARQTYRSGDQTGPQECDELSFLNGQSRVIQSCDKDGGPSSILAPQPQEAPTPPSAGPQSPPSTSHSPAHFGLCSPTEIPSHQHQRLLPSTFSIGAQQLHQTLTRPTGGWSSIGDNVTGLSYDPTQTGPNSTCSSDDPSTTANENHLNKIKPPQGTGHPLLQRSHSLQASDAGMGEGRWSDFVHFGLLEDSEPQPGSKTLA